MITVKRRAVIFLAAAWSYMMIFSPVGAVAEGFDKRQYCLEDLPNVVLYVDATTPYDDIDKSSLVDGVAKIYESLKGGERISIRTIEDSFTNSKKLVDECVPICPSRGFFQDIFSDCTQGMVISDRRRLKTEIGHALSARLANFVELKYSEIVRTIAMSSREYATNGKRNIIYIFSDMIENSEYLKLSTIISVPSTKTVVELSKAGLITELSGAQIKIFGMGRSGNPQSREALPQDKFKKLEDFWTLYFRAMGATASIVQNLTVTP